MIKKAIALMALVALLSTLGISALAWGQQGGNGTWQRGAERNAKGTALVGRECLGAQSENPQVNAAVGTAQTCVGACVGSCVGACVEQGSTGACVYAAPGAQGRQGRGYRTERFGQHRQCGHAQAGAGNTCPRAEASF